MTRTTAVRKGQAQASTTRPYAAPAARRGALVRQAAAHLSTSALCEAAGVSRGVLRLYEREGLVPPPERSAAGYRQYPAGTVMQLQAIRGLKELGFTLREIAMLLGERDALAMDPGRLQVLAQAQLEAIDTRIARLQMVRTHVAAVASGNLAAIDDPECHFLLEFLGAGAATAAFAPPARPTPKKD